MNQAVFSRVEAAGGRISGHEYEWPFGFTSKGQIRSSNKNRQVGLGGQNANLQLLVEQMKSVLEGSD